MLSLFLSQTGSSYVNSAAVGPSSQNIPVWQLIWAIRPFQDPATLSLWLSAGSLLNETYLLAAATHLKEHSGILVFQLKNDVWQAVPQWSISGRVSRPVVSLLPHCTVYASWMTTLLLHPRRSLPLGYSPTVKKVPVKFSSWYTEILRHWVDWTDLERHSFETLFNSFTLPVKQVKAKILPCKIISLTFLIKRSSFSITEFC